MLGSCGTKKVLALKLAAVFSAAGSFASRLYRKCDAGIRQFHPLDQNGFTLIEMTSVLIIMGVMITAGVKKMGDISDSASLTALKTAVRELNTRETLEWAKMKISDAGYINDQEVFNAVDTNLGPRYRWQPAPTISSGTLHHESRSVALTRTASTANSVGYWK